MGINLLYQALQQGNGADTSYKDSQEYKSLELQKKAAQLDQDRLELESIKPPPEQPSPYARPGEEGIAGLIALALQGMGGGQGDQFQGAFRQGIVNRRNTAYNNQLAEQQRQQQLAAIKAQQAGRKVGVLEGEMTQIARDAIDKRNFDYQKQKDADELQGKLDIAGTKARTEEVKAAQKALRDPKATKIGRWDAIDTLERNGIPVANDVKVAANDDSLWEKLTGATIENKQANTENTKADTNLKNLNYNFQYKTFDDRVRKVVADADKAQVGVKIDREQLAALMANHPYLDDMAALKYQTAKQSLEYLKKQTANVGKAKSLKDNAKEQQMFKEVLSKAQKAYDELEVQVNQAQSDLENVSAKPDSYKDLNGFTKQQLVDHYSRKVSKLKAGLTTAEQQIARSSEKFYNSMSAPTNPMGPITGIQKTGGSSKLRVGESRQFSSKKGTVTVTKEK